MKARLLFTSLLIGLSLNLFAENKKMVKSQLKEATVFFRGAELTHTAPITVKKGDNEISISGLSPVVDQNSIKIKTSNGILVSAFEFSVDYMTPQKSKEDDPEETIMLETIEHHKRTSAELETSIKVNGEMLTVLKKIVIKNVEGSEQGFGIDDLMKTLDYYKSKSLELENQLRADKDKKTEIQKEINKLNAQVQQELRVNDKRSGIVKLTLAANADLNGNVTISYYTQAASWVPYYDINVESTNKPIKITSKSKVRQTTGLDWEKVKLSFSTSLPTSGKVAPLFSAWFLQYYQPVARGSASGMKMIQNSYSYKVAESKVNADMYEEEIQEIPVQSPMVMDDYVTQAENELNITYNIDLPYTIPGTGKEINIELKNQEVPAEFKYYCAPKLDAETYVLAEVGNWQKLNLLSGNANVTYNGTYVGQTYIDAASTHENLSLTLGTDKRVSVKREKQQDYSSTKLLGSSKKQVFTYKLTVRNNQNVPVKMVLKDQYPKSTMKEIDVEFLVKETTKPTFNIEDLGVVTWEFDLQPGETKIFNFAYSVKYPENKKINL